MGRRRGGTNGERDRLRCATWICDIVVRTRSETPGIFGMEAVAESKADAGGEDEA